MTSGDTPDFDVAVIGAGINGAGIARDAALRGLRVIVLDKNDMCSGTSAVSSRLIHGGLRYLEYGEIPLVYESLHERRHLQKVAPHLVKPLRICIPIFRGAKRGPLLIRLGMIAYDLLSFRKSIPNHQMLDKDSLKREVPGINDEALLGAASYYDAQVTFAERLVLENLLAARYAGAIISTYSEVQKILTHNGAVSGVVYRDKQGTDHEVSVACIVNAAGPWVDRVLKTAPGTPQRFVGGTKGSHIIVGKFSGAPKDAFYVEAMADGRPIFIIPWNHQYLIGTTDIRYKDDLDEIRASRAEVDYLLAETNRVFPQAGLTRDNIHFAYAGVRPLPHNEKGPASAITRRHIIKKNGRIAKGMVSIIGGKLTTYRNLAEQTVDTVAKLLKRRLPPCRTADTDLPGTPGLNQAREKLQALDLLSAAGVERMLNIYGGRAAGVADLARTEPQLSELLDNAATVIAAEVVFALRREFATALTDIVFRRMMIGMNADQGRPMFASITGIVATELGWDEQRAAKEQQFLVAYADSLLVV